MSSDDAGQTDGGTPPVQQSSTDLPQWARESLDKANNEAAKYRTERNSYRDQHTEALTKATQLEDEKRAEAARAASAEKELLKFRVATQTGVPGDKAAEFASLLQGDNEDALKEHAKTLLGLFGSPGNGKQAATDPSQGRGDGQGAGLTTGGAFIAKALRARN